MIETDIGVPVFSGGGGEVWQKMGGEVSQVGQGTKISN